MSKAFSTDTLSRVINNTKKLELADCDHYVTFDRVLEKLSCDVLGTRYLDTIGTVKVALSPTSSVRIGDVLIADKAMKLPDFCGDATHLLVVGLSTALDLCLKGIDDLGVHRTVESWNRSTRSPPIHKVTKEAFIRGKPRIQDLFVHSDSSGKTGRPVIRTATCLAVKRPVKKKDRDYLKVEGEMSDIAKEYGGLIKLS